MNNPSPNLVDFATPVKGVVTGYTDRRHGNMSHRIGGDTTSPIIRRREMCTSLGLPPDGLILVPTSHLGDIAHVLPHDPIAHTTEHYFEPTGNQRSDLAVLANRPLSLHGQTERSGIESLSICHPGTTLGICAADCPCVALTDGRTVTLLHSGLTATVNRLAEVVVRNLANPSVWQAIIFPGIGQCCFDLTKDPRWQSHERYVGNHYPDFSQFLRQIGPALYVNLPLAIQLQLIAGGIPSRQIVRPQTCTCCTEFLTGGNQFFSYFRSETLNPNSPTDPHGRNMMFIGIRP